MIVGTKSPWLVMTVELILKTNGSLINYQKKFPNYKSDSVDCVVYVRHYSTEHNRSQTIDNCSIHMMNVIGNLNQTFLHFNKKLKDLTKFSPGVENKVSRRAAIVMPQNQKRNRENFNSMNKVLDFFLEVHHSVWRAFHDSL